MQLFSYIFITYISRFFPRFNSNSRFNSKFFNAVKELITPRLYFDFHDFSKKDLKFLKDYASEVPR